MIALARGDCLDLFGTLEPQSIDAVIADIPYGTTACSWDTVIPFAPMWAGIKRVIKPRGAIVLFGSQPFTSALVMSNPQWFKYQWVWDKCNPVGHLNAKIMPLPRHEDVIVFCNGRTPYNPQMRTGKYRKRESPRKHSDCYGAQRHVVSWGDQYYPTSILDISNAVQTGKEHPTQKPVALMEYLVRTYTNEGETVLDFTMGSGTTMVACVNTKRNGIGWELREDYFQIAQRRVEEAQQQLALPMVTAC